MEDEGFYDIYRMSFFEQTQKLPVNYRCAKRVYGLKSI